MTDYTFGEYQFDARRTQNKDLKLWQMREHALYGLSAEVGEVLGLHQKQHQGHVLDDTALRLEIGDILWFVGELCDVYGFDMGEVAKANIAKLRARYPDHFTAEQSVNRVEYQEKQEEGRAKHYAKGEGKRG